MNDDARQRGTHPAPAPVEPRIDLGAIVAKDHTYELSASYEPPEEAASRRSREDADARQTRQIRLILFLFALAVVSVVIAGCVFAFVNGSADDKKWAASIVSAVASGMIGYLVGQGKK